MQANCDNFINFEIDITKELQTLMKHGFKIMNLYNCTLVTMC